MDYPTVPNADPEKVDAWIAKQLAAAPPLTEEQCAEIGALLTPHPRRRPTKGSSTGEAA